jgi:hypothetical protein
MGQPSARSSEGLDAESATGPSQGVFLSLNSAFELLSIEISSGLQRQVMRTAFVEGTRMVLSIDLPD